MRAAALALLFWCAAAAADSPRTTSPTLDWLIEAFDPQEPPEQADLHDLQSPANPLDRPAPHPPTDPLAAPERPAREAPRPRHEPEIEFEVIVDADTELGGLLETLRRITPLARQPTPTSIPRP